MGEKFAKFMQSQFLEFERMKGRRTSQADFARWLGVKQPTLSKWMTGENEPDPEFAHLISQKLGSDVFDILGMSEIIYLNNQRMRQLGRFLTTYSEDSEIMDKLIAYMQQLIDAKNGDCEK